MRTITALQISKAFCRFDSVSLSVFPLPTSLSLSSLIGPGWYLHVNDFCVSAFLSLFFFFFVSYLHVSGFRCLMVLRWNESNLLCDSQTILPAITLIHSGQWILMTMKAGSCEEILQALVLVTLVWLSCGGSPVPFTSKRVYLMICSIFVLICWSLLSCAVILCKIIALVYVRIVRTILFFWLLILEAVGIVVLFIAPKLPGHCSLKSGLTFFMNYTTMWKPLHFQ